MGCRFTPARLVRSADIPPIQRTGASCAQTVRFKPWKLVELHTAGSRGRHSSCRTNRKDVIALPRGFVAWKRSLASWRRAKGREPPVRSRPSGHDVSITNPRQEFPVPPTLRVPGSRAVLLCRGRRRTPRRRPDRAISSTSEQDRRRILLPEAPESRRTGSKSSAPEFSFQAEAPTSRAARRRVAAVGGEPRGWNCTR